MKFKFLIDFGDGKPQHLADVTADSREEAIQIVNDLTKLPEEEEQERPRRKFLGLF